MAFRWLTDCGPRLHADRVITLLALYGDQQRLCGPIWADHITRDYIKGKIQLSIDLAQSRRYIKMQISEYTRDMPQWQT